MKSLEVSGFRRHLNQELKYVNKDRWMECPNEFNLDYVTHLPLPHPLIMCETQMDISAVKRRNEDMGYFKGPVRITTKSKGDRGT